MSIMGVLVIVLLLWSIIVTSWRYSRSFLMVVWQVLMSWISFVESSTSSVRFFVSFVDSVL